jgi:hypothetical protein
MDRERKDDNTLPGSLQSLRGEYAEIQQIYRERRSDMPQAQVTMDVRKVNERLLTYGLTEHYRNIFQTFCGAP